MRLELGTPVRCSDETLGELADVVIDPQTKCITHLVVESHHRIDAARLVPVSVVEPGADGELVLRCTVNEAASFDTPQDFAYLRVGEELVNDPNWDVGIEHVLTAPYSRLGELEAESIVYDDHVAISYDRVPKGTVEVRRASAVISAEGDVAGHVDGFVVGGEDMITHLVIRQGHLWGKRKVAVPIDAVTKVETDSVAISLSTRELRRLPDAPA